MSAVSVFETRANGKLLLTGEYFVLNGALALATPVRFGQTLRVMPGPPGRMIWNSKDGDDSVWFSVEYELPYLSVVETSDRSSAEMLASIIRECQRQNPSFLSGEDGLCIDTQSDFPRAWGLGTSSTLIAAIARWAKVDPYPVNQNTLGGSGYDLACAYSDSALLYCLDGDRPIVRHVSFEPAFSEFLYFVYLEKKQNSREGIVHYRERSREIGHLVPEISTLTEQILNADSFVDFNRLIREHEQLVSEALGFQTVKAKMFPDFEGELKSLGAWGGDFMLVSSELPEKKIRDYFMKKGFPTLLAWQDMLGGF